jgi:hypothetical protein
MGGEPASVVHAAPGDDEAHASQLYRPGGLRMIPARCHNLTAVSPRKARRLPADVPRRPRGGAGRAVAQGQGRDDGEPAAVAPPQTQTWPDGDWVVRQVPGAAAAKTYRCPGCNQEIRTGVPHVVVWPAESPGPAERRHWHNSCWQRRPRRGRGGR